MENPFQLFGNAIAANIIGNVFYRADKDTRHEMINQNIRHTERSYCESVFTRVRTSNKIFRKVFKYSAQTLDTSKGDGIFIFRYKNQVKVALVEAKLIRPNSPFDRVQSPSKSESHFYNQLINQAKWDNMLACFEMFIPFHPINFHSPPLDKKGSTCLTNEVINKYISNQLRPQNIWDLNTILEIGAPPLTNLKEIIYDIIMCNRGRPVIANTERLYASVENTDGKEWQIPLPGFAKNISPTYVRVRNFLEEQKLAFYEYSNLSTFNASSLNSLNSIQ